MNPDSNKFEKLTELDEQSSTMQALIKRMQNLEGESKYASLIRPNGEPVPSHWAVFQVDELYEIKGYTFRCKYIGETSILFEPVSPSKELEDKCKP